MFVLFGLLFLFGCNQNSTLVDHDESDNHKEDYVQYKVVTIDHKKKHQIIERIGASGA